MFHESLVASFRWSGYPLRDFIVAVKETRQTAVKCLFDWRRGKSYSVGEGDDNVVVMTVRMGMMKRSPAILSEASLSLSKREGRRQWIACLTGEEGSHIVLVSMMVMAVMTARMGMMRRGGRRGRGGGA